MAAGSGTGIAVGPRLEVGDDSKAGSAAQAAGGLLANRLDHLFKVKASAFTKVQAKHFFFLRSRGIYYNNFFCLLLTQLSAVETTTFPTFFSPIVFRAVYVVESLMM